MLIVMFHNDGTGTVRRGNYDVTVLINKTLLWKGRIEDYYRTNGWQGLVKRLSDTVNHQSLPADVERFLSDLSSAVKDGERNMDGSVFVMENDDAYDTLHSAIDQARILHEKYHSKERKENKE